MNEHNTLHYSKLAHWIDPERVFSTLFTASSCAFWLDEWKHTNGKRFSYMGADPKEVLSYSVAKNALHIVKKNSTQQTRTIDIFSYLEEKLTKKNSTSLKLPFPFMDGYVGYFGYELKKLSGAKTTHTSPYPDSLWYKTENMIIFDHTQKTVYITSSQEKTLAEAWFTKVKNILSSSVTKKNRLEKPFKELKLSRNHDQYLNDIATCKTYLEKGESYQICLTNKLTGTTTTDPYTIYTKLRQTNPAPYLAYFRYNDLHILSSSPEQFLTIHNDGTVLTKPMKGTIARGETKQEDQQLKNDLKKSSKEWSENAMIVDLLRNDLGKVCKIGSVKVLKHIEIETYPTLHTLVSTVVGKLSKDVSPIACIRACFPGGSMTGTPKIRTMEILDEVEGQARGIYSGSFGFIGNNQEVLLSMIIRTIICSNNNLSIGAGGAILIDSDPEKEYAEMLLKTKALQYVLHNDK